MRPIRFAEWLSFVLVSILFSGCVGGLALWVTGRVALGLFGFLLPCGGLAFYFFRCYREGIAESRYCWGATSGSQWLVGDAFSACVYERKEVRQIHRMDAQVVFTFEMGSSAMYSSPTLRAVT